MKPGTQRSQNLLLPLRRCHLRPDSPSHGDWGVLPRGTMEFYEAEYM